MKPSWKFLGAVVVMGCGAVIGGGTGGGGSGNPGAGGGIHLGSGGGPQSGSGGGTHVGTGGGGSSNGGTGGGSVIVISHNDELTAGTRLKVRSIVGSDGSKQQVQFQDTLRGEPCSFLPATDGTMRCMPAGTVSPIGNWYSDTQCQAPIFLGFAGTCPSKYGTVSRSNQSICSNPSYAYELHTVIAFDAGVTFYEPQPDGGCGVTPVGPPNYGPSYVLYRSTGVVSPSSFVQGNYVTE